MRALDCVHEVHSVQQYTEDVASEIKQGLALIDAANQRGVGRFVYSSVGSADEQTGISHFESKGEVEEHLRSSGLCYTIFRPVFFMENWQTLFGAPIQEGHGMAAMFRWFEEHGYHVDLDAVKQEYPQTARIDRWLKSYWKTS